MPRAVDAWRDDLAGKNRKKLAETIASPLEQADLFEGWEEALEEEKNTTAQPVVPSKVNGIEGEITVM